MMFARYLTPEMRSWLIEAYAFYAPQVAKQFTSAKFGLPLRKEIVRAGIIFVHVPKNAGTTISLQLYDGHIGHRSAKFLRACNPDFFAATPSFALYRDPVSRFRSAYNFARLGGSKLVPASRAVRRFANGFETAEDCARHIASIGATRRDGLDPVFRSQSHYLCDERGHLLVNSLLDLSTISGTEVTVAGHSLDLRSQQNMDSSHAGRVSPSEELSELVSSAYAEDIWLADHVTTQPA